MRQGQQSKRTRSRSRKGPNPLSRSYESNGPDVKIRGTALHVAEKYVQLARDAQSSGDRVAAENYLQHAEHYFRIVAAAQAQTPQPQPHQAGRGGEGEDGEDRNAGEVDRSPEPSPQPTFGLSEPQPYVNGNGQDRADGSDGANGAEERREARESSSSRSRRRRPYRERANGDQGEAANKEPDGPVDAATAEE